VETKKMEKMQKLFVIVIVIVTISMLAVIASQHTNFTTVTTDENPPFAEKQNISVPGLVGIITVLLLFLFKPLLELLSKQQQKGRQYNKHETGSCQT